MARRSSALPEKIAQDLMQRILIGEYDASNMLPSERVLQDSYSVSRTVVREALKLLAARGLVTTGNGQGAVLSKNLTAPAIDALLLAFHRAHVRLEDLLNARLLIEPEIAALAAQHATPLQIRRLHELSQAMAGLASAAEPVQAASRSYDVNAQFHSMLAQASQNPVLEILIAVLVGIIWRQQNTVDLGQPIEQHARTARQHAAIVQAIAARDPACARIAMVEHLETTRQSLADVSGSLGGLIQTLYTPDALPAQGLGSGVRDQAI